MQPEHASSATRGPLASPATPLPDPAGRWLVLLLLSVALLLGMSLWFTAAATATQLAEAWSLEPADVAWLTTTVQLGFVAGTALAAFLNVADLVPARRYFAVSAVAAGLANAAILLADGPAAAAVSRFLTGFFLAGVYPPAMKMTATWFRSARGLAIGTVVGALTVGKALPYLVGSFTAVDYRFVITTASLGALGAAALVAVAYRDGPFAFPAGRFSLALVGTIMRHRETRLAIGGYLGHMWELYAMWAAVSAFMVAHFTTRGFDAVASLSFAGLSSFAVIAVGGVGSVMAGAWADRWGRENVAAGAMAISGMCALAIGWLLHGPTWLVVAVGLVWGFTIVADSAQFSALVTEVSPPHAVGTALTLQTSLGFLLTALSIWLTFAVTDQFGWGTAFTLLALGPAVGISQMVLLRRGRRTGSTDAET